MAPPREDASNQVDAGWPDGPFPFDEEGKLVTGLGLQLANPASRFGAQRSGKVGASDDLKRSQTERAAATRAPLKLPTRGNFSAI